MQSSPITYTVEANPSVPMGGPVELRYAFANRTGDPCRLLTWNTPLEGVYGNYVDVSIGGRRLPYDALMVKRGDPGPEEYVLLGPGEVRYAAVDLTEAYPITEIGRYTALSLIRFHDHWCGDDGPALRPLEEHRPLELPRLMVAFEIVEGGAPRLTAGARARLAEGLPAELPGW